VSDPHPAEVNILGGPGSLLHIAIGFLASMHRDYEMPIFVMFTGYQVSQAQTGEDWQSTGGDFVEFGIGYLLGMWTKGKR
jgi:hypothetical protein